MVAHYLVHYNCIILNSKCIRDRLVYIMMFIIIFLKEFSSNRSDRKSILVDTLKRTFFGISSNFISRMLHRYLIIKRDNLNMN